MRSQPSANVWVVLQHVRTIEHGLEWLADVGLPAEHGRKGVGEELVILDEQDADPSLLVRHGKRP